jgi:hypothetical protein
MEHVYRNYQMKGTPYGLLICCCLLLPLIRKDYGYFVLIYYKVRTNSPTLFLLEEVRISCKS